MLIGILGAGQLGRMLALAGYPLGLRFRFLDPAADSPARSLGEFVHAEFTDHSALARFAEGLDLVTFEFENVPVEAVELLSARVPVYPGAAALREAQDRLAEKTCFQACGLEVHEFAPASTRGEFDAAVAGLGLPCVVKTRRMGYDGKGQAVARTRADADAAWHRLGACPLLIERFVPFEFEVSILAVRSRTGESVYYPLTQNTHAGGILRTSIAPAPRGTPELQSRAEAYAARVLDSLNYVGVLAIEFFVVQDSSHPTGVRLLVNEMAPRVHNSGHWTIEGARTSQFENHLRAITGLPLGSATLISTARWNARVARSGTSPSAGATRTPSIAPSVRRTGFFPRRWRSAFWARHPADGVGLRAWGRVERVGHSYTRGSPNERGPQHGSRHCRVAQRGQKHALQRTHEGQHPGRELSVRHDRAQRGRGPDP
jgi:5-(carboxyamino)imidazole ribonucleotide synthase